MTTRPIAKAETTAKPAGAQRKTRQRAAVEEILSDRHDFRTAQQIHDDLRHQGERIGLATVYRTLQLMTIIIWSAALAVVLSRSPDLRWSGGPMRWQRSTGSARSVTTSRSSAPATPVRCSHPKPVQPEPVEGPSTSSDIRVSRAASGGRPRLCTWQLCSR